MASMTPITPLEPGVEMYERRPQSFLPFGRSDRPRPLSEATEIFDTDFEYDDSDDESQFEEYDHKYSFESEESMRSQTTLSTLDEVSTPHSSRMHFAPFHDVKPVEGPRGPHLFRASQTSSEFSYQYALQMSPLLPKQMTLASERALGPAGGYPSLDAAAARDGGDVRSWTARDVGSWMHGLGLEPLVVRTFEINDINGAVLLDLQFDDLKELGVRSFGKRHQLWNEIELLRGAGGRASPAATPFRDTSRPCTAGPRPADADDDCVTPVTALRRRRPRRHRNLNDPITPAESVSIVAIEQLLPRPHHCAKGERCAKWRKQQRLLARLQREHGFPVSPDKGGHIFIAGDPGNPATAPHAVDHVYRPASDAVDHVYRPASDAVPSVVASSDLLGPGLMPEFALQEEALRKVEQRDPQENVKQFLSLQGVEPPLMHLHAPVESPPTPPPLDMFPPLQPPAHTPGPHAQLKRLPKLSIPRSASTAPQPGARTAADALSPCRSATVSPGVYRFGTPASEMDVPVTAVPIGPVSRDASQSVPPNMLYRDPVARSSSRNDWRRPSVTALPALNEGEVFSPTSSSSDTQTLHDNSSHAGAPSDVRPSVDDDDPKQARRAGGFRYDGVNHAGWMKKRRTKLLRHEWHDKHFRLTGTRLAMHPNELPTSSALETIDVDDYAVACSSIASNKLAAKLKSLKLSGHHKDKGADSAAFEFQLVPTAPEGGHHGLVGRTVAHGKNHHFAVKTRDERIDWMRELMLAKALKAKGQGYEVQVNGAPV